MAVRYPWFFTCTRDYRSSKHYAVTLVALKNYIIQVCVLYFKATSSYWDDGFMYFWLAALPSCN